VNLPPGWTFETVVNVLPGNCPSAIIVHPPMQASPPFCQTSPTWQTDLDAWVTANYTAPVTTTATTVATTTAATTTDTTPTTTALPPVTTTVVITTTTPASTTAAPVTSTATVTTTVSPVEQSLQAQIDALTAQIAALTDRVTRLEKAGDASWLAFQQAITSGADPATAAGTARGTWLNVVNGLGAFA